MTSPDTLYAKFEVGQNSAELLGKFEAQATVELLGKADITHSAELLSNFRVSCPRQMGGNWQRKMWFDGTYYWRSRYDPTADDLIFEYIAAAGLADNVWTINANASIDASGFAADAIIADFTVRGGEIGIPTTIHYSDGVDSYVAESDEASLTGWAWQNLTKVFDGTAPDYYRKVNLGANRKAIFPVLWVTAVFYDDDPDGKQWVITREQSTSGDITGWNAPVDVSNVDNTSTIYGCSVRAMGAAGAEADDIMVVYKEGDALRSRYYTGVAWQAIQDIDTTTLPGKAAWDFEHGEVLGVDMGHILYVDADGSVKWRERDAGAAAVWSAAETLHGAAVHQGVGIVEHGAGWLWAVWVEGEDILEYRVHQCVPEVWYPLLANPALQFDVSTEAVVKTSTVRQLQTSDWVPSGEAVPICWIGETAPATPCAVGWGILIEYSIGSLYAKAEVRNVASAELYARFEVGQGSAELLGRFEAQAIASLLGTVDLTHSVDLLGKFEAQAIAELLGRFEAQATAELLGKAVIRNIGSAELLGRFEAQATAELLGRFEVGQDSADLLGEFDLGQGSADLLGRFEVGQDSAELLGVFEAQAIAELLGRFEAQAIAELLGRFEAQAIAELLGKAVIRNIGSAELLGRFEAQDTAELLGRFEAQAIAELLGRFEAQDTADLLGRFEAQAIANLLGKVDITHSIDLLGKFEAQDTADLLGRFEAQATAELLGRGVIRHSDSAELLGKGIIRHTDTRGLVARCVIRHSATKDLDANVEIVHWESLYCKTIIRHTATFNLPAIFWARWPRRLWTNRRYVNGVIELDEKLLGDASLEYVIEGVMEDTQGYLDNAGLSYSEWTDITLVPVQILRAVTYGTVAALYARHTQTFRSQVIPSVTPVTVTVIGDAEKAMNYWEERMNQMLEFYVTSQGGDVMLTSTPDEEPIFSMEDIPEEVTEFVSWRIWLQERGN